MNDYDFEKMAEGGVSFENLTGRLQKLAESFASAGSLFSNKQW